MRLLSLNIQDSFTNYLEENNLYITDKAEDFNDAIYHSEVRYYNMILVQSNDIKLCYKLLKNINPNECAVILISNKLTKDEKISLYKKGLINIIYEYNFDLLLARVQSIHRENFIDLYNFNNTIKLNRPKKYILDNDENPLNIKGKSFEILFYLIKNRNKSVISKDELVNAIWDEPELICNNVVEVNINQIRNEIRKNFNTDMITTIRNRGYKINESM